MFWNDPNLYTANLPFREIGFQPQVPFVGSNLTPWQAIPRFAPPTWGTLPPYDPRMLFANPIVANVPHPFVQNPFIQTPLMQTPFMQTPFVQTPFAQTPFAQPFNVNPALYNMYRPITY